MNDSIPLEFTVHHNGLPIAGGYTVAVRFDVNGLTVVHLPEKIAYHRLIRLEMTHTGEFAPGWQAARVRLMDNNNVPMTMVWNALIATFPAPFPTVIVMPSTYPGLPGAFAVVIQEPSKMPPAVNEPPPADADQCTCKMPPPGFTPAPNPTCPKHRAEAMQ